MVELIPGRAGCFLEGNESCVAVKLAACRPEKPYNGTSTLLRFTAPLVRMIGVPKAVVLRTEVRTMNVVQTLTVLLALFAQDTRKIPHVDDETSLIELKANPERYVGKAFVLCGGLDIADVYRGYYLRAQDTHYSFVFSEAGKDMSTGTGQGASLYLSKRAPDAIMRPIIETKKELGLPKLVRARVTLLPKAWAEHKSWDELEVLDVQFLEPDFSGWRPWIAETLAEEARRIAAERSPTGLGRTREQILKGLDKYFPRIEKGDPVHGMPRCEGRTPDGLATVEIIGEPHDIRSVSVSILVSRLAPGDTVEQQTLIFATVLNNALPGWAAGTDWLKGALSKVTPAIQVGESEVWLRPSITELSQVGETVEIDELLFVLTVRKMTLPQINRAKEEAQRAAILEAARWRTWTTADGRHKVEAKFVTLIGGTLTLEKRDGTTVDVKLSILCPEDQSFVKRRGWEKPD